MNKMIKHKRKYLMIVSLLGSMLLAALTGPLALAQTTPDQPQPTATAAPAQTTPGAVPAQTTPGPTPVPPTPAAPAVVIKTEGGPGWSKPVNVSVMMKDAWFPDLTVDSAGKAYLIYLGNDMYSEKDLPYANKYDRVYYQPISPEGVPDSKGPYNVEISPVGLVPRTSITADSKRGLLHTIFRARSYLFYTSAPIDKATNAAAWSEPRNIDDFGNSYYSDIAVDRKGVIHIVWTASNGADAISQRQIIYYRNSSDLGQTWSFPKQIGEPKFAATRPVLQIDAQDGLHISWDDGYDNLTGYHKAALGGYTRSLDGGNSWTPQMLFGSEAEPIGQVVVSAYGDKEVVLAWRILNKQEIGYMFSENRGESWSAPAIIAGAKAKGFGAQHHFDRYQMAADSNGRVHLVYIGEKDANTLGTFMTTFSQGQWSAPEVIGYGEGSYEYPRIALGPDRIHIVWFTRDKYTDETTKGIWYSSKAYDTGNKAQPVSAYVPPAPTPTPAIKAVPTATPLAIKPPLQDQPDREWLGESYKTTALALVPLLAIGLVMTGLVVWQVRFRNRG